MNKKILKLLSFAGKDVAFSPFERSQSKPKMSSLSPRFGFQSGFLTLSPPEHNDVSLLKLHMIRNQLIYNDFNYKVLFKEDSYS